jgi:hypothetical protein
MVVLTAGLPSFDDTFSSSDGTSFDGVIVLDAPRDA